MELKPKMRKTARNIAIAVSTALFSSSMMASSGWLSKSIDVKKGGDKSFVYTTSWEKSSSSNDSQQTLFDVTISLHNSPAGDSDPTTDVGDPQETYEEIIRFFADSVCEQTNGSHQLRKVRIFRNNERQSQSDIIWGQSNWPRANASGFGATGAHIWFGDVFPGGGAGGGDYDMLANPEQAGYTLGHEWGHYAYGLFDEYLGSDPAATNASSPQVTDVATSPSIMHSQWRAVANGPEWLNHSTQNNIGDVARTAQGRVYGKSGWEVLVQDVSEDPRSGELTAQPNRTRYTSLANVAPSDPDWVAEELPGAQNTCRSELDIIWVDGSTDIQVVIDRSGSMSGSAIANAKQAARLLVDAADEGKTSMGIVSFSSSSSITQNSPLQPIPDPDTDIKTQIKNAIDLIRASGSTSLYNASQFALNNLITYQTDQDTGAVGVVFVLADGDNNSGSVSQNEVIANYQAADIPIFSFGYGSASPTGPLLTLANSTGGNYFSSPTTLAEITDAFLQANAIATNTQNLLDETSTIAPSSTATFEIVVDSDLEEVTSFVSFDILESDLILSLTDSVGTVLNGVTTDCTSTSGGTSCTVIADSSVLASAVAGTFILSAENTGLNQALVDVNTIAKASSSGTFATAVSGATGNSIEYPAPFILTAATIKDYLVTNLNISATVTGPFGQTNSLLMFDDGTNGDAFANDGIYSTIYPYTENGIHQVEVNVNNDDANAEFTLTGLLSATVDGTQPALDPLPAIANNFRRIAKASFVVQNVPFDDFNDSPSRATLISTNNVGINGVIDDAGDSDFYVAANVDTSSSLVVRVTDLSSGIDPTLNVYAADGTTPLLQDMTLTSNPSATGYLYTELAGNNIDSTMYLEVKHGDASADRGGYQISIGSAINTDVPPNNPPVAEDDSGSVFVGNTIQLTLTTNDTDADGDTIVLDGVNNSQTLGQVIINDSAAGLVTYDPDSAFDNLAPGTTTDDSFTYIISDGNGGFSQAFAFIEVRANALPVAVDDAISTDELTDVTFNMLDNDSDPDGHTFTVTAVDDGNIKGVLTDNGDGTFSYSPDSQFTALKVGETEVVTFTYEITDDLNGVGSATVTITVIGVNQSPEAGDDTATVNESATVEITVLDNDTDVDSDTLSVASVDTSNTQGTVTINASGTVTYSPNGQFDSLNNSETDTDTFTYALSDGTDTVSATVTVTINGEGVSPSVETPSNNSGGGAINIFLITFLAGIALIRRRGVNTVK